MKAVRRIILLILCAIETLFFGGIIAGFSALEYVLILRGVYGESCLKESNRSASDADLREYFTNVTKFGSCKSQTRPLSLAFSLALFFGSISLLITGPILDTFGVRILKIITAAVFSVGILFIGLTAPGRDWLIFPGLILVSASGVKCLSANLKIVQFYPGYETIVSTILSGAFDSSAVNFQFLKLAFNSGIPYVNFLVGYGAIGAALFIINGFFYPNKSDDEEVSKPILKKKDDGEEEPKKESSFLEYALSFQFVVYVWQFAVNYLMFYLIVSCNNHYISVHFHGDLQTVRKYTSIFSYMLMAGILVSPLPALLFWVQKRAAPYCQKEDTIQKSLIIPFSIASALGVLATAIYVAAQRVTLLYVAYPIIVLFRTFTFASSYAYISVAFPREHLGKLFAIVYTVIAFTCLLVFPFNLWVLVSRVPFYLLLGVSVFTFANPFYIYYKT